MADSRLTKYPPGVLELLTLKNEGTGPDVFGGMLVPTFDAIEFYAESSVFPATDLFNGIAQGTVNLSSTAPYARRVLGLGGTIVIGADAGTWLSMRIGVRFPQGFTVPFGTLNLIGTVPAGSRWFVACNFPKPLVLPAGHQYELAWYGDFSGADHVGELQYVFHRLDVSTP